MLQPQQQRNVLASTTPSLRSSRRSCAFAEAPPTRRLRSVTRQRVRSVAVEQQEHYHVAHEEVAVVEQAGTRGTHRQRVLTMPRGGKAADRVPDGLRCSAFQHNQPHRVNTGSARAAPAADHRPGRPAPAPRQSAR